MSTHLTSSPVVLVILKHACLFNSLFHSCLAIFTSFLGVPMSRICFDNSFWNHLQPNLQQAAWFSLTIFFLKGKSKADWPPWEDVKNRRKMLAQRCSIDFPRKNKFWCVNIQFISGWWYTYLPLWKMMDESSVGMINYSQLFLESHKIPWFQSKITIFNG